jgi:hypothetical protein
MLNASKENFVEAEKMRQQQKPGSKKQIDVDRTCPEDIPVINPGLSPMGLQPGGPVILDGLKTPTELNVSSILSVNVLFIGSIFKSN